MNYNVPYYGFIRNFGIDEIYSVQPGRFTSTTILATRGAQKVTVSDVLKAAGYLNDFIKANFDVTDTRYSETLLFLKTINLAFNNQQVKRPSKERMHYVVDVIHEVTDLQATCSEARRANARIALTLNAMIDMFGPAEEDQN